MQKDKVDSFLIELTQLTKKHGIAISALGDKSPFLFYPLYLGKNDKYSCDLQGNNLVWSGDSILPRTDYKILEKGGKRLKLHKKVIKEFEQKKQTANQNKD